MADTDGFLDQEIVAKTLWGEARSEGQEGMEAVADVIRNRVNSGIIWWGNDFRSVCLKPFQFSCWLPSDPNRPLLIEVTQSDPQYASAVDIAGRAMGGSLGDIIGGSDSYKRSGTRAAWADGRIPVAVIGHHEFYKIVLT